MDLATPNEDLKLLVKAIRLFKQIWDTHDKLIQLMSALDDLTAQVANEETVVASAIVLINGFAARLAAAGQDPKKLKDLQASLKAGADSLAAAVAANTPPPAGAPAVSAIADEVLSQGQGSGDISFTVASTDTPPNDANSLTVAASSSNQTLIPDANVLLGGSGGTRTINVTPLAGQTGTATIVVTVSDVELSTSVSFNVTVS